MKCTITIVQNTLMYIKWIGTPQKVIKLQPNLQLNEYKGLFLNEKLKKLINMVCIWMPLYDNKGVNFNKYIIYNFCVNIHYIIL